MAPQLSKKFIEDQQKKLQEEKTKISSQIQKLQADDPFSDADYANDNAAVDTDVREQDYHAIVEAQIKQLEKRQKDIDHTLGKMAKGKYGVCENCNRDIPQARLELVPEARLCVDCEKKKGK
jgi:RNA polymerase-binding transcription factor DksA